MFLQPFALQAKEELESWGLRFAPDLVQLLGRKVNSEKIMFRKNTIIVNEEADWGRDAVKENVLSAVSWMSLYSFGIT